MQSERAECGLACLSMLLGHFGHHTSLPELRDRLGVSPRGASLAQLLAQARRAGLVGRSLRCDVDELDAVQLPAILHWQLDHFVVLEAVSRRAVRIVDPRHGRMRLSRRELERSFTGVVVELSPSPDFSRRAASRRLGLAPFLRSMLQRRRLLLRILLLSVVMQGFLLLAPFFSKLVIDEVLPAGNTSLLYLLATAFLGIAVLTALAEGLRAWTVVYLSNLLDYGWRSALHARLLALPLAYFERRSLGDTQSRVASLGAIRDLLSKNTIEVVMDLCFALPALLVMWSLAPMLAALVLATVLLLVFLHMLAVRPCSEANTAAIAAAAARESILLESIRAAVTIRCYDGGEARRRRFDRSLNDSIERSAAAARYNVLVRLASSTLGGGVDVLLLFFAAELVMREVLTLGGMIAFLTISGQFRARVGALAGRYFQFRISAAHLERLADIALQATEPGLDSAVTVPVSGHIEARDIEFAYDAESPAVLAGISLDVPAGSHVAITGPSGCGKSTLLRLLAGLHQPSSGRVVVDGEPLIPSRVAGYRRQIATVLQEDRLLSGSLLENVAFFSEEPDEERAWHCCEQAMIADFVHALPMRLATPVGDHADALSAGQRQRLLLARALYRQPKVLLLDEATSQLDVATERRIVAAIDALSVTRIVVAHRRASLDSAERVIRLG